MSALRISRPGIAGTTLIPLDRYVVVEQPRQMTAFG